MLLFIPLTENLLNFVPYTLELFVWIPLDGYDTYWSFRFDPLVKIMLFVVTTVSFLVHVYSISYMSHDASISRFMMLISLFTFFMLLLVSAADFIQLFCGWEGVGLCSYLLIGFWFQKESATYSAKKAFIVNRVGDLGLIVAMGAIYYSFGSFEFSQIFEKLPGVNNTHFMFGLSLMDFITLMLFIGAMGKSAQFGLHVWLPDAMEGPTPVSALIHAATMVTAGVFLMVRCSPLLEYAPMTKDVILIIGSLTAFFAATVAITQTDIKRIIAYSTCSQLGYMFMSIGSGFYTGAVFHLFTHAFFKAALFLGAGSVIHAFSDEQDIRKMGQSFKKLPYTYAVMWIGSLALVGFPPFSGFFSKESIIHVLSHTPGFPGKIAYITALIVSVFTAFYAFRLIFLVFHGKSRSDDKVYAHIHESSLGILGPLGVMAFFAAAIGFATHSLFLNPALGFWEGSYVKLSAYSSILWFDPLLLLPILGFFLAWLIYIKEFPLNHRLQKTFPWLHTFLLRKWFIDELYLFAIIKPALFLANVFWKIGDEKIIERFGPQLLVRIVSYLGIRIRQLQTGFMSDYVMMIMTFVVIIIPLIFLWGTW
jgi:NADH-quinone oxidoreductase subunit L